MEKEKAVYLICNQLGLRDVNPNSEDDQFDDLSSYLNDLIQNNFNRLLNILYRIDISERKLNIALENNKGVNSGQVIAKLLIEREKEKIKSRKLYRDS